MESRSGLGIEFDLDLERAMDEKMILGMMVSDIILELVDDEDLRDMPRGDLQGVVEAQAMKIVKLVRN